MDKSCGQLIDALVDEGLDEERAEEIALDACHKIFAESVSEVKRQYALAAEERETEGETVTVTIGRALRPGVVEVTVANGHATAINRLPWKYRSRPGDLIRELLLVEPQLVEPTIEALPQAHQEAAEADATPLAIEPVLPDQVEDYLAALPPNLEVPGWYGLTLPRDWSAPTLFFGPSKVGKSWVVAAILAQLAGAGVRSLVLATEGSFEWLNRLKRYPVGRRPIVYPDTPDVAAVDRLVPVVESEGVELIVVDVLRPLFRRLDVSENGSEAIDAVLAHLQPLRAEGRCLMLIHHEGKVEELGPRGSSALTDQAGLVYQLEPDEEGPLALVHPRAWRSGPLDSQPTLKAFFREDGTIGVEPHQPPDPAEERIHAITGALTALAEPTTISDLNLRVRGASRGKVTSAELFALEAEDVVHHHKREGKGHPLWLPGKATPECCQA